MPNKTAIDLLKQDHERVRGLLAKLVETTTRAQKTRTELIARIELELEVHTRLEEEIFYPAFKDAGGKDEAKMYFEAKEEHRAVSELVLPDLRQTDPESEQFSGRAKVLEELVEHHVKEEESEMFKMARKLFSRSELVELGQRLEERKREILEEMGGKRQRADGARPSA